MSEVPLPNQEQLGGLYDQGAVVLRQQGLFMGEYPGSQPSSLFNGRPVWDHKADFAFEFSVASVVLQRLAPDQAEVLGLSIDNTPDMVTDFVYEALRCRNTSLEAGENLAHHIEGGRLDICSGLPEGDYTVMHSVYYKPSADCYGTDLHVLEDAWLPPGFEPDFTLRAYVAAQHMLSLLPQIARLEF